MHIQIQGAREHNLKDIDVEFSDGLTVVTGVSGSGKTSLVFDTLYHEARRRFLDVFSTSSAARLPSAHVASISGLGPAIAVGQNLLNRNPNSILATASGLHPFLRLLYTHFGQRTCPRCASELRVYSEDEVLERLAALLSQGQVTLSVPLLRRVPGSHATLLGLLEEEFGRAALQVDRAPWDGERLESAHAHDLDLVLAELEPTEATTSDLRDLLEQANALGAQAVMATWSGGSAMFSFTPVCVTCGAWFEDLRPVHFHQPCPHCSGQGCERCAQTGLPPQAAAVRWQGLRLPELLELSVNEMSQLCAQAQWTQPAARLRSEIERRLEALQRVGLGYVQLNRPSPGLSRGEAQRVRLALALVSRLEDLLHVLDEPTIGQHPADVARLMPVFRQLPGPVIYVEHDRQAASAADRAIDLGPGAGVQGGQVIFSGTPADLWQSETSTGRFFSLRQRVQLPQPRPAPSQFLTVRRATLRNLQQIDIPIPLHRLTVVSGISGSGKSTLVEDVLFASLSERHPVGCAGLEGQLLKAVMVDQSPIGRNPRSNPATYTKLADLIRDLFASQTGLSPSHFSFNRPVGACPTCSGLGAVEVSMRYLPSEWVECADCEGQRFSEQVLAARVAFGDQHLSIADFYHLQVAQVLELFQAERRIPPANRQAALRILQALEDIGLSYLELGQPSPSLSGGEAQRIKLARYLGLKSLASQLLILDEPSTGLHPQDLAGLLTVLDRLVRSGATILVVEHNTDLMRAADWVIDLGPGAGPQGGRLLYAGPPEGLLGCPGSQTGLALSAESQVRPAPLPAAPAPTSQPVIAIRQARLHNLKQVDVDFPKGALTVVTGLSGSGKSSLVSDVLESEARRRFLETLTLYERQGTHEGPQAEVDSVSGLGVALSVTAERLAYSLRATVGTLTEISHHLAALLAVVGERTCLRCGAGMERQVEQWSCPACGATAELAHPQHFSASTYAAACQHCNGVGSLRQPAPEKLIIAPEKPLLAGAMYSPGFFPKGYLGKPFNHGHYLVLALAERYGFDPFGTPWNAMSAAAQQAFLFGDPNPMPVTVHSRTGRTFTHSATFPGFYGFLRDWDVGGTYTVTQPCPRCNGARLRPEYLAVRLAGHNIHELGQMTLAQLSASLEELRLPPATRPLVSAALPTIRQRLGFLNQVGLSYLHLERVAGTLSAGEVQRIRLAGLLGSGLTSLTLLLDEPTRGLHPSEVEALLQALQALRKEGNTVIVVEHDPLVMRHADHLVDMGPGAGEAGGRVAAQGSPAQVAQADTLTARWLRGERQIAHSARHKAPRWMTLYGARANNLQGETVRLPLGVLAGVCGVSGSGKSTLIIDTLGRALAPRKQTTSVAYEPVEPGEHQRIEGAPRRVLLVDQSRRGLGSPASFLNLTPPLRALYAASEDARALGLSEQDLAARCSACGGSGLLHLEMGFLPDIALPCEVCQGTGYLAEAWQVRLKGCSLPQVYSLTIDQVFDLFGGEERLAHPLQAARDVGLGYLVLRQPGRALSGGEVQRLKIAQELALKSSPGTLYLLDEPTVGQHLEDVQRLVGVLRRLVDEGGSVIVVEHHPHLLAACDWLVELGPGGGPQGGRIIASGPPEQLARGDTPTAPYLREVLA